MVQFRPYQMNRFRCMVDVEQYKQDICYQVNQSLIAVGSGGFLGIWGWAIADKNICIYPKCQAIQYSQ